MDTTATLDRPASAETAPRARSNKRTLWIVLGALALIGGIFWGIRWWTVGRFIESTDDAYLRADSVTVAPKVSGYVTKVYIGDNEAVSIGQPLVQLDGRQYEAALEQANAT